jgi:hypothetical protein
MMPFSHRARSRAARRAIGLGAIAFLTSLMVGGSAEAATPTPVLLGNAGLFALLAGSGTTNTGVTTINGDVGSSPLPSETGFAACPAADCVALTGANHTDPSPNDAVTQSAKADLITAYNNAAGQTPTQIPTELAGNTYTAGVYNSAAGTFGMTGTLVLDGENNADATFIFQTASTLITAASGNVTFIRGAQACNVFWKVGSAATLGAGSNFSGTILAHDTITLGDGVTVSGRLLAAEQGNAGAVTLIHDTITKPATCVTQASIGPSPTQVAADKAAADKAAADKAAADKAAADTKAAAGTKAAANTKAAADAAVATKTAAAHVAAVASAKTRHAKAAGKKAATSTAIRLKRTSVRKPRTHTPGFTG